MKLVNFLMLLFVVGCGANINIPVETPSDIDKTATVEKTNLTLKYYYAKHGGMDSLTDCVNTISIEKSRIQTIANQDYPKCTLLLDILGGYSIDCRTTSATSPFIANVQNEFPKYVEQTICRWNEPYTGN